MNILFTLEGLTPKLCCDPCHCSHNPDRDHDSIIPLEESKDIARAALALSAKRSCPDCQGTGCVWESRALWDVLVPEDALPAVMAALGLPVTQSGSALNTPVKQHLAGFLSQPPEKAFGGLMDPETPWITAGYCYRRARDIQKLLNLGGGELQWSVERTPSTFPLQQGRDSSSQ